MSSPATAPHAGRALGFERLVFFSDAVFAIAITLLVLDLKPPLGREVAFDLRPMVPNLVGFGLSFYVVGRYWLSHHRLFETVRGYDARLLATNLAFLAAIVFLPFPTSVVAEAKAATGPVVFYALSVAAVGLLMIVLALIARRPALLAAGETRGGTLRIVTAMAGAPLVFLASAAVALRDARWALWLLVTLIPIGPACDRLGLWLQSRIDGEGKPLERQAPEGRMDR
jgi:uncharacterized membrane protein